MIPLLTRAISERFRDDFFHNKALNRSTLLIYPCARPFVGPLCGIRHLSAYNTSYKLC